MVLKIATDLKKAIFGTANFDDVTEVLGSYVPAGYLVGGAAALNILQQTDYLLGINATAGALYLLNTIHSTGTYSAFFDAIKLI